jgi:hypothetical protein
LNRCERPASVWKLARFFTCWEEESGQGSGEGVDGNLLVAHRARAPLGAAQRRPYTKQYCRPPRAKQKAGGGAGGAGAGGAGAGEGGRGEAAGEAGGEAAGEAAGEAEGASAGGGAPGAGATHSGAAPRAPTFAPNWSTTLPGV